MQLHSKTGSLSARAGGFLMGQKKLTLKFEFLLYIVQKIEILFCLHPNAEWGFGIAVLKSNHLLLL